MSADPASNANRPAGWRVQPLYQLVVARLREFIRQPEAVFWVYVFPILMVIALGIAFKGKPIESFTVDAVEPVPAAIAAAVEADPRFKFHPQSSENCRQRLRVGKSDLYLQIAADVSGPSGSIEYFLDPTRPQSLVAKAAVDDCIQRSLGRVDAAATKIVEVAEPGGRYIDFLVPGLLGMGLMGGGMFGVGFAIVDMRIRKLLRRFLATPMRRSDFLASLMLSRLVFMVPEIILLLVFARFAFGVQIYGNPLTLVVLILLGALLFGGIGLLVASRARTLEAASGLMNLAMLPMWTLSGVFFSYERFPEAMQFWIKLLPLTALIDSLRGAMVEGRGLPQLGVELAIMAAWTALSFGVALAIFRWND